MAPRGSALPQATTESARAARKMFFCELCGKGYARMNEFEAHEGSYDHQHRKRLKDMKQLSKDSNAAAKARASDIHDSGDLKAISLSKVEQTANAQKKKKKPVFLSTVKPQVVEAQPENVKTRADHPTSTESSKLHQIYRRPISVEDLDAAGSNDWKAMRCQSIAYSQLDHHVYLRYSRGQRCAGPCDLCAGSKPVPLLIEGEQWDDAKDDTYLQTLGREGIL